MERVLELVSFGSSGWGDEIASGVLVTVSLALATLPFGLALGFLIALAKISGDRYLKLSADIFTTIFRGLPELLTLFLVYYGAQIALQHMLIYVGVTGGFEINAFVAGMVALGVVFAAYASEVFVAAFTAIPRGQYEGAAALGLGRRQTLRLVILPQLIRVALPGLSNLWLILLKETSLVSVIGLSDLLRQSSIAARVSRQAFLFYLIACLIYLVLAMLSSIAFNRIERKVATPGMTR